MTRFRSTATPFVVLVALLLTGSACSERFPRFGRQEIGVIGIEDRSPFAELQKGGQVIFFRHAQRAPLLGRAERAQIDGRGGCQPGTSLNPQGRRDSQAIRATLRRYRIPVGEVVVSPTCRTREMARILFGDAFTESRAIVYTSMYKDQKDAAAINRLLRDELGRLPPPGTNRVLISHGNILTDELIGFYAPLAQGSAALILPLGNRRFKFGGRIELNVWSRK